jgi:hypothetical protein
MTIEKDQQNKQALKALKAVVNELRHECRQCGKSIILKKETANFILGILELMLASIMKEVAS